MSKWTQPSRVAVVIACLAALTACDKFTDQSRAVQSTTKAALDDAKASWSDFFMYHPPLAAQLPQTRYCYQMQSDLVCYDSEQRQLTSKLVGYQDGENISWVQPGGGSLGASGGEPVALRHAGQQAQGNEAQNYYAMEEPTVETGPTKDTTPFKADSNQTTNKAWLYDKSSDTYRKVTNVSSATSTTLPPADSVSAKDLPKSQ